MRLSPLRRHRNQDAPGVSGVARLDRRTQHLTRRLRPGDIAVIDHLDLDRASAEALVACRVSAVVNAAESVSGRYPNLGPEIIAAAGIPLIDAPLAADVFGSLHEGDRIRVEGGTVLRTGAHADSHSDTGTDSIVLDGELLDRVRVGELMDRARTGLSTQLEAFTLNTVEFLRRERALLLDGVGIPETRTELGGRHVLLVVRGYDYRADLTGLRDYIREHGPVLVGVDGGADALVELGYAPDLIVGDIEAVSDATLGCGAEVVRHLDRGADPGGAEAQRLERLGVSPVVFACTGTSEDVAMLLADAKGASVIVTAGTHATLVELLDRGRSEMASAFLTRLRLGPKLVDAKAVHRLYRSRVHGWHLLVLLLAGVLAVLVAVGATPVGQDWLDRLGELLVDLAKAGWNGVS